MLSMMVRRSQQKAFFFFFFFTAGRLCETRGVRVALGSLRNGAIASAAGIMERGGQPSRQADC